MNFAFRGPAWFLAALAVTGISCSNTDSPGPAPSPNSTQAASVDVPPVALDEEEDEGDGRPSSVALGLSCCQAPKSEQAASCCDAMLAAFDGPVEAPPVEASAVEVAAANFTAAADQKTADWTQWGGSPARNNTPAAKNLPETWDIGEFDEETGEWKPGTGENIKWVARLGSQTYGNPVIAGGQVYVGTNNGAGWLERYPADVDLGCLLCFRESDGKFLWQHSSEKLATGRVHDWPLQGICCSPLVEGERLWFVTSRGEVMCLDTQGFYDGENDGPYTNEVSTATNEADVIWVFDMMKDLGVSQHNMCSCSVTAVGDLLFVCTSNGVDESHINLPAPDAASFICLDKNTGKLIWADKSPGRNILHGQWSSPAYGVLGGVPQVMFAGGDGYLYSFRADAGKDGKPELLWKFDANPKESEYILGGRGTRNEIIATPVIYDGLVYLGVGQDPEHGEGEAHLWCIDPTKRGDVSPQLVFNAADPNTPIPHKRLKAAEPEKGDIVRDNPNSAVVWHYHKVDRDGNGKFDFEEVFHRTIGTVAIAPVEVDGETKHLLFIPDFSGLVHCVDAKTGEPYWTHDMLAASWGSPLIADGKVYVGDEDGDVTVFKLSPELEVISEINMGNSVYSTPVVANGVLYIANKTHLFAIQLPDADDSAAASGPAVENLALLGGAAVDASISQR